MAADRAGSAGVRRARRRVGATSALVVSLLALAGCSGGAGDATPAEPSSPTATTTTATTATPAPTAPSSTQAPGAAAARPRALFFGDSYFVGGPYTGVDRDMAALAADRLGWTAVIRGGGGTGFTAANPDYDLPDYLGQIADGALDVGRRPVDWLVVEGGGNDRLADPAAVRQGADEVLRRAAALHPEARLVLVGAMDPTVDDLGEYGDVNAALRAAADAARVPFIDPQRWLAGRPDLVGPDFDHPLPDGAALMGRNLADALAALGG